jgi:hypothetical protein
MTSWYLIMMYEAEDVRSRSRALILRVRSEAKHGEIVVLGRTVEHPPHNRRTNSSAAALLFTHVSIEYRSTSSTIPL